MANFLHHSTAFESTADFVIWLIVVGPSIVAFLYLFIRNFWESLRNRGLELSLKAKQPKG
jgi:hypothetical protein